MNNESEYVIQVIGMNDIENISRVVKQSFETAQHSDGQEHILVKKLMKSDAFIPELSLGAMVQHQLIAQILFTKATVNQHNVLVLAPLSVLPHYQNKGVGKQLITKGHMIAETLGFQYSIVLGEADYYSKVGYVAAQNYGIYPPFREWNEYFLAYKLDDKALNLNGVVQYPKEFGIDFD